MAADTDAQFNIHDAKTNLSRIIERVEHGEEIVISRAGTQAQHENLTLVTRDARCHKYEVGLLPA